MKQGSNDARKQRLKNRFGKRWNRGRSKTYTTLRSVQKYHFCWENGAPGETRTPDPLLRRQTLYPTELRARSGYV